MTTVEFALLVVALVVVIALQVLLLLRARSAPSEAHANVQALAFERVERELRQELQHSAQATRQELAGHMAQHQGAMLQQLESMRQQMQLHAAGGREEQARSLKRFA